MIDAPDILETTLRDGNYLVDFQFTARDTGWLAAELERSGLHWIEVGHGLGLGASRVHRKAHASDVDYVAAAREATQDSTQIGVFAIPGVATLDDLKQAADAGLTFVRIGTNVDRVADMEPFVVEARRLGLRVFTNFMKSYGLPPAEFAQLGRQAEGYGSEMNYLVDSAGCMLPEEVGDYVEALATATSVPVGFHGHDNIRLAVANSLAALEHGAALVDTTLFGVGRGSGNAATELMAPLMQRRFGYRKDVDVIRLTALAEREAVPLQRHRGAEAISMSLGLARVHSMYLDRIVDRAQKEVLDPHQMIAAVGAIDCLSVSDETLDAAVADVRAAGARDSRFDGGLLTVDRSKALRDQLLDAENIAEKLGVPCQVWLLDQGAGNAFSVDIAEDAVRVVAPFAADLPGLFTRPSVQLFLDQRSARQIDRMTVRDGVSVRSGVPQPDWVIEHLAGQQDEAAVAV